MIISAALLCLAGTANAQAPDPQRNHAAPPSSRDSVLPLPPLRTTYYEKERSVATPTRVDRAQTAARTVYYTKEPTALDAPTVDSGLAPVVYQDPAATARPAEVLLPPSATRTVPPQIGEIGLKTEGELAKDITAEVQRYNQPAIFKNFPSNYEPLTNVAYSGRSFEPTIKQIEPAFTCYSRLYFEDRNTERHGWDLGGLQPVISSGKFFLDLALLPYHFGTRPCQRFETNAGYCLPGDPVPYLLYPPEFSVTGAIAEAGAVVGLAFLLP